MESFFQESGRDGKPATSKLYFNSSRSEGRSELNKFVVPAAELSCANSSEKYISIYVNTCILGRMCFVERSIRLIEEHDRSSGFRSFHRLMRQYCFVWFEVIGPHSSGNF